MVDSYRHKGLRKRLVEGIRAKGIKDERVLTAIGKLPRHYFLEKAFVEVAYEDRAFPIGHEQTISQPFTVAYQTELLEIEPRQMVLEIGTGSGYQAAILALMGARVFTIERQKALHTYSNKMFELLGLPQIRTYFRDGNNGLPEFAPFDKIIVTAAAPEIPEKLSKQLKVGGVLIVPVGGQDGQVMYKITRLSETKFDCQKLRRFKFVPFLPGTVDR